MLSLVFSALVLSGVQGTLLPAILWDPRNPFFSCEEQTINVALGNKINFVCPNQGVNYENIPDLPKRDELFESAYLLQPDQEENFKNCNATGGQKILSCDGRSTDLNYNKVVFKEFFGSVHALGYKPGKTYYMIGTGFRKQTNQNNLIGGSCQMTDSAGPYKLRMKIRICTDDEVNVYKNCTRCTTTSCYYKGCTNCTLWSSSAGSMMTNMVGKCYNFYHRTCTNKKLDVTYMEERKELASCPSTPMPTTPKPTQRLETTLGSTKPKPQSGGRVANDGDSDSKVFIVGIAVGIGGLLIGLLLGYFGHKHCSHVSRIKSVKFRDSIKSNGTPNGITNKAFQSNGTLERPSPDLLLRKVPPRWDGVNEIDGSQNKVPSPLEEGIEIKCDMMTDDSRGLSVSSDQKL